jgi:phosphopantothenoylcysteine decarboxylase/phosphopantothenate--cysteine ligase
MDYLAGKRVVVGITGGIAAYKSAELVRLLRRRGADVRVILTESAVEFVTPLTLQTLSGHPVHRHLIDEQAEQSLGHIELARWADVVLVAPASANTIARLAQGRAEDLLSAVCLATEAPCAFAPAMNRQMWENTVTRGNVKRLEDSGWHRFGPGSGEQACGEFGEGRMLEPVQLADELASLFASGKLAGLKVVVTAGPTWEAIDPVRGLTNRSSGKMGYAVAVAAREAGANVILISGPTRLSPPEGIKTLQVESAVQMLQQAQLQCQDANIFIGAAAVADFRPANPFATKVAKDKIGQSLELERNPDIIATLATEIPRLFTIGFAAETGDLAEKAKDKLEKKRLDLVAANRVDLPGQGMESNDNALLLIDHSGSRELPLQDKSSLARLLINEIAERYHAKNTTKNTRQANRE